MQILTRPTCFLSTHSISTWPRLLSRRSASQTRIFDVLYLMAMLFISLYERLSITGQVCIFESKENRDHAIWRPLVYFAASIGLAHAAGHLQLDQAVQL